MDAKLVIVLALCVAAVVAGGIPAAKYPAGVNPHACPNYPYCDNVALATHSAGHHGALAPHAYAAYGHHVAHGAAAKYPAGVDPHNCPNYPYCDNVLLAAHTTGDHGAVAPYAVPSYAAYGHQGAAVHGAAAQYPAGVSPHLCPNYPFCGPTPAIHAVAHHGGLTGVHGEDDGSYRPWEYETPYQHQYDDGQYHH